jgi:hypothetical protein
LLSIKTENSSTISIISAFEEGLSSIQLGEWSDSRPVYFIHEERNRSRAGLGQLWLRQIYCCSELSSGISLMMEAVRTSETSVDNHFTRQYIPEDNTEH